MRAFLLLFLLLSLFLGGRADAGELKLAAWNLSWLTTRPAGSPDLPADVRPKRMEDIDRLRGYALQLDADVIAFSEVDGPEVAALVFPPERWRIHITHDQVVQRVGLAISRDLAFTVHPDLAALDPSDNAAFHLRSGADVTLDLPSGVLRLLAVHLKSGCREAQLASSTDPACQTLARQVPVLHDWIAAREASGEAFMLMGDFNRWMAGRDRFFAGLAPPGHLLRADAGLNSPCWGGSGFLDHLIAGGAARSWMRPQSFRVLVYRETEPAWKDRLSDHCPISVRLDLGG